MKQPIVGYHLDDEGSWVAELACGHAQHIRHEPPWQVRPWVTSPEGRASFLGYELDCLQCDLEKPEPEKPEPEKPEPEMQCEFAAGRASRRAPRLPQAPPC